MLNFPNQSFFGKSFGPFWHEHTPNLSTEFEFGITKSDEIAELGTLTTQPFSGGSAFHMILCSDD